MFYFFFSYSRDNNDSYLREFYKDLDQKVKTLTGEANVSFIDQEENELGDNWEHNLENAISQTRVFVAIITASYCKKEWCLKEWGAFMRRIESYSAAHRLKCEDLPLIMPLYWSPPHRSVALPYEVKSRHLHIGNPNDLVNTKGIWYLTKLAKNFQKDYEDTLNFIADRIISLASDHQLIDEHKVSGKLKDIEFSFDSKKVSKNYLDRDVCEKRTGGLKCINFVYGALTKEEANAVGRYDSDSYHVSKKILWQPYYPDRKTIGEITQNIASSSKLGMISFELEMGLDLPKEIERLEKENQLVVIVLDYWLSQDNRYKEILARYDKNNYMNCAVLLLRNAVDYETNREFANLNECIKDALIHRFKNNNDLFLKKNIKKESELREELQDTITRLKAEIINHRIPGKSTILPSGGVRPLISGV